MMISPACPSLSPFRRFLTVSRNRDNRRRLVPHGRVQQGAVPGSWRFVGRGQRGGGEGDMAGHNSWLGRPSTQGHHRTTKQHAALSHCGTHAGQSTLCDARLPVSPRRTTGAVLCSCHAAPGTAPCLLLLQVTEGLLSICKQHNVEVMTSTTVRAIRSQGGSVTGVELQDGTLLKADVVVTNRQV